MMKNKIKIHPIDALFEVLEFTTFSIYLLFHFSDIPIEWYSSSTDISIWVTFQFEWHSNLSDIPNWVTINCFEISIWVAF